MKNIQIDSRLTTNLIIDTGDNIYISNSYNEYAKFIAQAFEIDDENKTGKFIRFESNTFIKDKIDIHREWLKFDSLVQEYCQRNPNQFKEFSKLGKPILINWPLSTV